MAILVDFGSIWVDFGRLLEVFGVICWYVWRSYRLQRDSYNSRFPFPLCVRFWYNFGGFWINFGFIFGGKKQQKVYPKNDQKIGRKKEATFSHFWGLKVLRGCQAECKRGLFGA